MTDDALDAGMLARLRTGFPTNIVELSPVYWKEINRFQSEVADRVEALLAALKAEGERGGQWQPIETAPQNLNVLVAYKNGNGKWRIVKACYHTRLPWSEESYLDFVDQEGEYAPQGWYEESDTHETIHQIDGVISHWMSLPPPPALPTEETDR